MTGEVPPGGWDRPIPAQPVHRAPLAGWWRRVGAALVDLVVLAAPAFALTAIVFGGAGSLFDGDDAGAWLTVVLGLLFVFAAFTAAALLYGPLLMRRAGERNGQTWGKQLAGIRVVRANGAPMDFAWSAAREVGVKGLALGIASTVIPVVPYLLDALWPLWDDENRALHDYLVDTRVVRA